MKFVRYVRREIADKYRDPMVFHNILTVIAVGVAVGVGGDGGTDGTFCNMRRISVAEYTQEELAEVLATSKQPILVTGFSGVWSCSTLDECMQLYGDMRMKVSTGADIGTAPCLVGRNHSPYPALLHNGRVGSIFFINQRVCRCYCRCISKLYRSPDQDTSLICCISIPNMTQHGTA